MERGKREGGRAAPRHVAPPRDPSLPARSASAASGAEFSLHGPQGALSSEVLFLPRCSILCYPGLEREQ
ncbi:hypothetical protein EYF80_029043 [Liparis tanakae]|uniref:Uncharacterized protein n=1 Tax=Liparis tanakae TaxID=230148 RepID=A0A4Z2H4L3_9TELE|nr:hypothetical protein EYF80_029043 [Liparis tanakae]